MTSLWRLALESIVRTMHVWLVISYAGSSAFGGEAVFTARPTAISGGNRLTRRVAGLDLICTAEETCQIM